MYKILAVDPGVMTGYAYAEITDEKKLNFWPFQMTDDVDDFWRRLDKFSPDFIVMEDFEYRNRARVGLNLFPVQMIGVARLYELTEPSGKCVLRLQKAAQGKAYYSDTVLKSINCYKRGVPHGMDATRHLLQWATFGPGYEYISGKTDFTKMLDTWEGAA
jgi:hypothetical protein